MSEFPIGYRTFHPDVSFNYELNRWRAVLPDDELEAVAARLQTHADWKELMLERARTTEQDGREREAAFYWRATEFFLHPDDPDKEMAYERFASLFARSIRGVEHTRLRVPLGESWLPAMVLEPAGEAKETILLHGGFDSFMEELFDWGTVLREGGYRVVLFEGPGQGAALRRNGLVMGPDWERPVAAVLDHLEIRECTIFGISLGGYLAPRAAAFEPRIRRVVVCDVLDDFFDCFAERSGGAVARLLDVLTRWRLRSLLNAIIRRTMSRDPSTSWALGHGMHVSGARDPYEFVHWLKRLTTSPFSARITQDVLLLAGANDHIVPLRQLYRQAQNLINARSVTTRLFTHREHAGHHCQIGNVGLMLELVVDWLDLHVRADARWLETGAAARVA